jgi:hypothetical protein
LVIEVFLAQVGSRGLSGVAKTVYPRNRATKAPTETSLHNGEIISCIAWVRSGLSG